MAEIIWTQHALADLNDIAEYIAKDSPHYAQRTVELLYNKVEILSIHPKAGRIVPELNQENTRELIEGNYRLIYELKNNDLYILTIHHSARVLNL